MQEIKTTESRKALVTGAASGIGLAVVKSLIADGHSVVMADVDAPAVESCVSLLGPRAIGLVLDIADESATARIAETIPAEFSPIDTLINNAGHHRGGGVDFADGSIDDWASIVETNLIGTMRVTRGILSSMRSRNRGDIVNITSINALRIIPHMGAYSASKAGIHMLSDTLRAELASTNIRVIEIAPGLTRTNIQLARFRGDESRAREYFERFRMSLTPEDVARSVMFALTQPRHVQVAQMVVIPTDRH
jgi:3-hydroxy acid dehydrogenase/malonic semialdehyde reductase